MSAQGGDGGVQQASVDEVTERHERSAVADFLDDFRRQLVDFRVAQFTVVVPDPRRCGGRLEGARETGQHGATGRRALGQGLPAHAGQHGFPGLLGGGVDVEAAVIEGIA